MSRSKRSSASPPEFFADRCLGKTAPRLLIEWGWIVHLVGDHFPEDAEQVSDPEWIEYGLVRRWSLLTQDLRISGQSLANALLRDHHGSIFCLDSAELPIQVRAQRFHSRQSAMYQHVRDRRVGFLVIAETGRPRQRRTR